MIDILHDLKNGDSHYGYHLKINGHPRFATLNLDAVGGLHKSIRRH